ncbi:DUF2975 domain-containing protein [Bacillus spongiae]|uniref:DUF2975 domain-containing protein n=1 Tax=Bacillus spongiae TaxID=2683610 RepID=A0ABU8HFW7_9BACI
MNKRSIPYILNFTLVMGILITLMLLLGTPLILTAFFKSQYQLLDQNLVWIVTICIYLCAAPYVLSLFKLRKIAGLVVKRKPFSNENVKALKVIAVSSFSEIVIFIGCVSYLKLSVNFFKDVLLAGPLLIVIFICVTIGLLCLVLAQLLEVAINIKEENDKTI